MGTQNLGLQHPSLVLTIKYNNAESLESLTAVVVWFITYPYRAGYHRFRAGSYLTCTERRPYLVPESLVSLI